MQWTKKVTKIHKRKPCITEQTLKRSRCIKNKKNNLNFIALN